MKYSKPGIHSISTTNVAAHCIDGSGANVLHTCENGPQVDDPSCTAGTGAENNCAVGNVAELGNCSAGIEEGVACFTGTSQT